MILRIIFAVLLFSGISQLTLSQVPDIEKSLRTHPADSYPGMEKRRCIRSQPCTDFSYKLGCRGSEFLRSKRTPEYLCEL